MSPEDSVCRSVFFTTATQAVLRLLCNELDVTLSTLLEILLQDALEPLKDDAGMAAFRIKVAAVRKAPRSLASR